MPNPLTNKRISDFLVEKFDGKKLYDAQGLLLVNIKGRGYWRFKYRINGKEKTYSLGTYPTMSLTNARSYIPDLKKMLSEGKDPIVERKLTRRQNYLNNEHTFREVAEQWFQSKLKRDLWSEVHYKKSLRAIERDIYPDLGSLPINKITAPLISSTLFKIIDRGSNETAQRIHQHITSIFSFAQVKGYTTDNPALAVKEVLRYKSKLKHHNAILNIENLREILRKAELVHISPSIKMAHLLCAFTAARIDNVVTAEWSEFDLTAPEPTWLIPRNKMKYKGREGPHVMPLCRQLVDELKKWQTINNKESKYLFPSKSTKSGHISKESVEKVYRVTLDLRGKHSPHGWRSSLATLASDNGFPIDAIELALDHALPKVISAYNRGGQLKVRREIYDWWGNQLTGQYTEK